MLRIGVHHDHELIGTPGLCEVGVGATAGNLFGPLQPLLHRGALQMTEER